MTDAQIIADFQTR